MSFLYKIKRIVEKEGLIERGDRVLVGISGGIDSTSLVHVLFELAKEIGFDLGAVHLNHLLRGEESERDERFVSSVANKLAIPLYTRRADAKKLAEERGLSVQHAGRDLRYGFFEEVADRHGYSKIAIAHNLDDQAETFLLRMIKGTGIRGLTSIPIKRGKIIRPFLHTYRSEIEDYAARKSITYVHDSSNDKTVYERNFVRKSIIPLMEQLNPLLKGKIIALLEDLTAVNSRYDSVAKDFVKSRMRVVGGEVDIEVAALCELDEETRFRVLIDAFLKIRPRFMPLREHMRLIDEILTSKKPNLSLAMPEGVRVRKVYDRLIITKKTSSKEITEVFPISLGKNRLEPFGCVMEASETSVDAETVLKAGMSLAHFDQDRLGKLYVRTFRDGDRFYPLGMKNPVKLKDFFISQKIPKEDRRRIPLLLSDDHIIWVVGYRMDERHKITETTQKAVRIVVRQF